MRVSNDQARWRVWPSRAFGSTAGRVLILVVGVLLTTVLWGQVPPAGKAEEKGAGGGAAEALPLPVEQRTITAEYARFQDTLLKLLQTAAQSNPEQVDLLQRALSQSTQRSIKANMEQISELLASGQLGEAQAKQLELLIDLQDLLKLLQSENERDRLANEAKRIEELLNETNRILGKQKDVRADTQRGKSGSPLDKRQAEIERATKNLGEKIDRQDALRKGESRKDGEANKGEKGKKGGEKSDQNSKSGEKGGKEGEETKKQEGESGKEGEGNDKKGEKEGGEKSRKDESKKGESGKEKDGEQKGQDGQKGESGKKTDGQKKQGEEADNQGGEESSGDQQSEGEQQQTPGRKQLENARKRMQQALEDLEKQLREKAVDRQDQAIRELEAAKHALTEILRQLREDEEELVLASLEARFQKMLKDQTRINEDTVQLDAVGENDRDAKHQAKLIQLSRRQNENFNNARKARDLLQDEGTSIALPETLEQVMDLMQSVSRRIEQGDTAKGTQNLEGLIVESLHELINAVQQKLQQKQEQRQQQQNQEQDSNGDEQRALSNQLAELRMIRSLQVQINRLTTQYGAESKGRMTPEVQGLVDKLAHRQERLHRATYDLATGKNE